MKTVIGTIAIATIAYLTAFPVTAATTEDSQNSGLVNHIDADKELTASETAWQRAEFYSSFGGGGPGGD